MHSTYASATSVNHTRRPVDQAISPGQDEGAEVEASHGCGNAESNGAAAHVSRADGLVQQKLLHPAIPEVCLRRRARESSVKGACVHCHLGRAHGRMHFSSMNQDPSKASRSP